MLRNLYYLCQTNIVVVLIGILISSGCSASKATPIPTPTVIPSPEQMDKSLFTGIPCAIPCWHGLEVGVSSERDVISVLPTLIFIDQDSIQMYRRAEMTNLDYKTFSPGIEIVADCVNPSKECLTLIVANNILTKIVVGLNYEIKIDKAIEYLGNPNYVGYGIIGERFVCEVYLVWDSSRLVLASRFEGVEGSDAAEKNCYTVRDTGKILSNSLISEARYLSTAELDVMMSPESSNTFFEFTGTIPE